MALQSSGAIKLSEIATEFEDTAPHSMSEFYDAASGVPASGAIGMTNFYGKSNGYTVTIDSDTANVNLRSYAVSAGWDEDLPLIVTINSGVSVYSTSVSTAALIVSGDFANGVTLNNLGTIVGEGGAGGGSNATGSAGGAALSVSSNITIDNENGTIAGGGGGGGGGGSGSASFYDGESSSGYSVTGGTGGKGAGYAAAQSGTSGTQRYNNYCGSNNTLTGGSGGSGGAIGSSGNTGGTASTAGGTGTCYWYGESLNSGGSGGAAGSAVAGNSYVTWTNEGTRLGAVG